MKKFWKVLGIAAIAAAAVPISIKKDEEKRRKTYRSLLFSVDVGHGENGEGADIGVNLGEGVLTGMISEFVAAQKETELFADDELGVDILQEIADEAQEAADEVQAIADEAQEAADEAQAIANEAQAIADEAAEAAETLADDDDEIDSEF